jgi:hypothetical protein
MQCKQVVEGKQCPLPATLEVFWPGQRTQQCQGHEQKLQGLAMVMGFALESRLIVQSTAEGPTPDDAIGEEEAEQEQERRHEQPVLGCDCHDCIR